MGSNGSEALFQAIFDYSATGHYLQILFGADEIAV
jgi:hypothetical protein